MLVSKEFKVGIIVVLSLLLIFIVVNFLKDEGPFDVNRQFYAEFEEVNGLQVKDQVQLNGVKIGEVNAIDLKEGDASMVTVSFLIQDKQLQIPHTTYLWLISTDFVGTKALEIRIPPDSLLGDVSYYQNLDTFRRDFVNVEHSFENQFDLLIGPIQKKTKELVGRVEDIVFSINSFWDTSAAYTVDESMFDVRNTSRRYKELVSNVNNLIANSSVQASVISKDVKGFSQIISGSSAPIIDISNNLTQVTNKLSNSNVSAAFQVTGIRMAEFDTLLTKMSAGEGTIGQLQLGTLKEKFVATNESLEKLKDKLEARPKDFIGFSLFGLKHKGYQPGKGQKKILDSFIDSLDSGKQITYEK